MIIRTQNYFLFFIKIKNSTIPAKFISVNYNRFQKSQLIRL